jgi:hypothetical protein
MERIKMTRAIFIYVFFIAQLGLLNGCESDDEQPVEEITPENVVTIYQECGYSGYAVSLPVGNYNLEQLKKKGVRNNDISSVKVNSGIIIRLFDEDEFSGSSLSKIGQVKCLTADNWDNKATSFIIEVNGNTKPPAAPDNLEAIPVSDTRIKLSWSDNSDDEDIFVIEVYNEDMELTTSLTVGANIDNIVVDGLTINSVYYIKVLAESLGGLSKPSNRATVTTLNVVTENIDDLMKYAGGFSKSDKTPMGTHFENLRVTTDELLAYLNDPGIQPPNPNGLEDMKLEYFPVTLYPDGTPVPADINQHAINNCNGLTAMASIAYQAPSFVKSLITDNGDKTYTVKMFDPAGQRITITVDNKFLSNSSGIQACTGKNGIATWATVLEKAIMKYNVIYQANADIGGIGSEHVTPLFTGEGSSYSFDRGILTANQLARVVRFGLSKGMFISGGFDPSKPIGNVHTVTTHGYALFISNDANALFAMRNPWGANPLNTGGYDSSTDGVLTIPSTGEVPPTIDLRLIEPGIAGTNGRTDPYTPPSDALKNTGEIRISVNGYK